MLHEKGAGMNVISEFIIDKIMDDMYNKPDLDIVGDIISSKDNEHSVSIFRSHTDYIVYISKLKDDKIFLMVSDEIQQYFNKIENLVLEYSRNILFVNIEPQEMVDYTRKLILNYKDCIFTNPNGYDNREDNCHDCCYMRKGLV